MGTHAQTSAAKGAERAADCVAFELMMVGSFELCKLHKDPITKVMPVAGASCSVKARSHAPGAVPNRAFSALSHPCGLRTASQVAHPSNPKTLRSKSGGRHPRDDGKKKKNRLNSCQNPAAVCGDLSATLVCQIPAATLNSRRDTAPRLSQ